MRTWTQFCVLALAPLLLTDQRGFSDQAAGFAVVAFSAAGAAGTLAGASLADRVGGRRMLVWSMPVVAPLIGAFLLERFFGIPGIGREVILAVERSDFPVIKAITVYVAAATMIFNLLTDLLYQAVDPRVQLK